MCIRSQSGICAGFYKSRHRHRSGGLVNCAENQLPYTLHRINRANVFPPNGRITLFKIRSVWIIIFLLIESGGGVSPFLYRSKFVECIRHVLRTLVKHVIFIVYIYTICLQNGFISNTSSAKCKTEPRTITSQWKKNQPTGHGDLKITGRYYILGRHFEYCFYSTSLLWFSEIIVFLCSYCRLVFS